MHKHELLSRTRQEQNEERLVCKGNQTVAGVVSQKRLSGSGTKKAYTHIFPIQENKLRADEENGRANFFKEIPCDAKRSPEKNLYGKEITSDYKTFALKINKFNLTQEAKAVLIRAHHVFRQVYNATIFFIKQRN